MNFLLFAVLGSNLLFGIGVALYVNVWSAFIEAQIKMVNILRRLVFLDILSAALIYRIVVRIDMIWPYRLYSIRLLSCILVISYNFFSILLKSHVSSILAATLRLPFVGFLSVARSIEMHFRE